jgi:putative ABC transport system ATP-binding protein
VVNLMKEMAEKEKTTIIMVTHDNKILDVADRIILVEEGELASSEKEAAFVERMRAT